MAHRNRIMLALSLWYAVLYTPLVTGAPRRETGVTTPPPMSTLKPVPTHTAHGDYLDQLGRLQRLALRPTLFIKCGGPGFIDDTGVVWQSDFGLSKAATYGDTTGHGLTLVPKLYSSGRSSREGPIEYHVPLPLGAYTVTFYFMELYQRLPGRSVFDIEMEGGTALKSIDLVGLAGCNKPFKVSRDVELYDGVLDITVRAWRGTACLSAFSIGPAFP